jgi:vacuolar-type H+-ATPase subunit I/STV1
VSKMGNGHGEKRSRKTEEAIIALLTEPTIKLAAEKVRVSEVTLWRWMQEDDFIEQYRSAKKQAVSQAVSRLQQSCGEAVETLREIMQDIASPAPSRVAAAKTILEMAFKAVEIEELEQRINQLEQQQGDNRMRGAR